MAYQSIGLGTTAGDGTGDTIRVGGDKVNDNFVEIYTVLGTGTALSSGISATATVITLASPVITGALSLADGSATAPAFTNNGDTNTGIYFSAADTVAVATGGTLRTTVDSTGLSVAGAILPTAADGGALGSATLEWSDLFLADSSVVYFGASEEITLTHVHNVGLTLTHTATGDNLPIVLQLKSEEDAIIAGEVIASLEFAAGDSGGTDAATVAAGIHAIAEGTFAADANATKLVFTTGVSETAASSATAKMTLSSAGLLTIADDFLLKDDATIGVASSTSAITIASSGIVTFVDDILIKDAGTIGNASVAAVMTLASTGIVTFVDDIILKDAATIGVTSSTSAISIASSGIVTFVDDIAIKDGGTIGTATTPAAVTVAAGGNITTSGTVTTSDGTTIGLGKAVAVALLF